MDFLPFNLIYQALLTNQVIYKVVSMKLGVPVRCSWTLFRLDYKTAKGELTFRPFKWRHRQTGFQRSHKCVFACQGLPGFECFFLPFPATHALFSHSFCNWRDYEMQRKRSLAKLCPQTEKSEKVSKKYRKLKFSHQKQEERKKKNLNPVYVRCVSSQTAKYV